EVIKGIIDVVLGILTGDWSRAWEGIKSIFSGVWTAITGILSGAWDLIKTLFSGALSAVTDTVSRGFENVVGFFRRLPGRLLGFLAGLPAALVQLGIDMIAGLLRGFGDIAGRVYTSIKDGIASAVTRVKSFFGVSSPSKFFRDELGKPFGE